MDESAFKLSDLFRRMENIVRRGRIAEVDTEHARVRISIGENTTDWLPWLTFRAGLDRSWSAPSVGEQVLVISESGEFNNGLVLFGIYQTDHPAPSDDLDETLVQFEDGAKLSYHKGTHAAEVTLPNAGEIMLRVGRSSISIKDDAITITTPHLDTREA